MVHKVKRQKGNMLSQVQHRCYQILSDVWFAKLRKLSQEYYIWKLSTVMAIVTSLGVVSINEVLSVESSLLFIVELHSVLYSAESHTSFLQSFNQIKLELSFVSFGVRILVTQVFLTVTCSTCWPEIVDSLFPRGHSSDRPDLCVCVF